MRKLSFLFLGVVMMSQLALAAGYPLNGSWELMDPESWNFKNMQKNAPEGFYRETHIATILQRLIVVLTIYLYLHLSQK